LKRWWWLSPWGWISYESARLRGEAVAYGHAYGYFVGGSFDGKRAYKGPMLKGPPD
jgi:hypothetical protein